MREQLNTCARLASGGDPRVGRSARPYRLQARATPCDQLGYHCDLFGDHCHWGQEKKLPRVTEAVYVRPLDFQRRTLGRPWW